MIRRSAVVLPWLVQEASLGERSHFGGTTEKGPYFMVFKSLCFYKFLYSFLWFLLCPAERKSACMLEPTASAWVTMRTYPPYTWWQWKGIFHGIRKVPKQNAPTEPLEWACEVKDGIPSPIKSPWKFPALGPSVPQGTICSWWATPQEGVFTKTSRLKLGRVCE